MPLPRPTSACRSAFAVVLTTLLLSPLPTAAQQLYDFGTAFGRAATVAGGDVLVGEPQNVVRPGHVYVFGTGSQEWQRTQILTASDAQRSDGFGRALAGHGDALLVGAPRAAEGRGAAYLFVREAGEWKEAARLDPAQGASGIGGAVAISGTSAAVVERLQGQERVRVYRRSGNTLQEEALLRSGVSGPRFGGALAFAGEETLLVCSADAGGSVVLESFTRSSGGSWNPSGVLETGVPFSASGGLLSDDPYKECGLAAEGSTAAVGTPQASGGRGAVTVFSNVGQGASPSGTQLTPPPGGEGGFGTSVALAGGTLWVGAPNARSRLGAVARFQQAGGSWGAGELVQGPGTDFMPVFGLALAAAEELAVVGSPGDAYGAGVAVGFRRTGDRWSETGLLEGEMEGYEAVTGDSAECVEGSAAIFSCEQMDLVAMLPVQQLGASRGAMVNDVWGWVDPETAREYAVVGRSEGTSFVDVTDPARPIYLGQMEKTEGSRGQAWRDVKVIRNHAVVVADNAGQHGMQVFDLTRLRSVDPANPPTFEPDAIYSEIASSHNVVVNEETGFVYTMGNSSGGRACASLHIVDMNDPKNPTFAGCYNDPSIGLGAAGQTHDAQCVVYRGPDVRYQGREICFAYGETSVSIGDVTDKAAPVILGNANMPSSAYIHQGWLTEDQRYIFVNDELDEMNGLADRTRTLIWDVSDLEDPIYAGEYLGETSATDHNLYIVGDLMYQSNYAAGLRVIDISDPLNAREVGFFDTAPFAPPVPGFFDGSWSNYPFFPSGNILVTSHKQGLFILKRRPPIS